MMNINLPLCLVRGGGDLATGVIFRLSRAGFPVVVLELAQPRVVRRAVSVAEAIYQGEYEVDGIRAIKVDSLSEVQWNLKQRFVPVLIDKSGKALNEISPDILIDGRMLKRNPSILRSMTKLVIGMGPGFNAGENCHAVVETMRGHSLGRVLWKGAALADTGVPEAVDGRVGERVLRAPANGELRSHAEIGTHLKAEQRVASVNGQDVLAPFEGVLRGLMHMGTKVSAGEKIGDVDPRSIREHCFTISDKALAIGGGVLEAIMYSLTTSEERGRRRGQAEYP